MSAEGIDLKRRRFLTAAATAVGGVGAVAVAVPFVLSMQPSARAQAAGAPVEVDISKLESGQMMTVAWRGKPVWIVNRPKAVLDVLPSLDSQLLDPNSNDTEQQPPYAKNEYRSRKPEYLVLVGICARRNLYSSRLLADFPSRHRTLRSWAGLERRFLLSLSRFEV